LLSKRKRSSCGTRGTPSSSKEHRCADQRQTRNPKPDARVTDTRGRTHTGTEPRKLFTPHNSGTVRINSADTHTHNGKHRNMLHAVALEATIQKLREPLHMSRTVRQMYSSAHTHTHKKAWQHFAHSCAGSEYIQKQNADGENSRGPPTPGELEPVAATSPLRAAASAGSPPSNRLFPSRPGRTQP